MDKTELQQIFDDQLEFQGKAGRPYSSITSKKIQDKEYLSEKYILLIIDELIEVRNCYNKKEWVKKKFKVDKKQITEEISDVWLFLINLTLTWDISVEDLISEIKNKQIKNNKRLQK